MDILYTKSGIPGLFQLPDHILLCQWPALCLCRCFLAFCLYHMLSVQCLADQYRAAAFFQIHAQLYGTAALMRAFQNLAILPLADQEPYFVPFMNSMQRRNRQTVLRKPPLPDDKRWIRHTACSDLQRVSRLYLMRQTQVCLPGIR